MKLNKKIAFLSMTALAVLTLAACSSSKTTSSSASSSDASSVKGDITLWVDPANVASYKTLVASFEKEYTNVNVKLTQSPTGSANAKTDIAKDPSKAADVFKVPNDQLGALANAGYINPLSPDATNWVKTNDIDIAGQAVSWQGKYYAYPQDQQSNVIFYNKDKFQQAPASWSQFTATTAIGTDFTNSYNWYPAFLSNGSVLYGKDGETLDGTDANKVGGVETMTWFAKQKTNTGVVNSKTALLNDFQSGKTSAVLDGPWDAANIKKFLGDKMGVTTLPKIDFGSGEKQMQAFSGVGTLAVNSQSKYQKAASALAEYLSNADSQKALYTANAAIPVAKSLQTDSTIKADPVATAVINQVTKDTLMPKRPEMATFWTLAAPMISNTYEGKIPASDYQKQLDTFVTSISKAAK
ncbi:MAG: extracellular solute-binding protein [Streptococcaceae bacterium]|jgi:arabinogalactan oligomer/maltooligosaccharide transport system substrate-binding protein|nr:extracellular solute-binding protein [Streptococcaceae bacterium]